MICPNCGRETPGKFCPFCGAKLPTEALTEKAPARDFVSDPGGAADQAANPGCTPYPNQAANPGYAPYPNQAANPGYASYPNQTVNPGFAPQRGAPAPGGAGFSRGPAAAEVWKTPASQYLRRLGSSGAWILAALAATVAFLISVYLNVFDRGSQSILYLLDVLPIYRGTELEATVIGNIVSIGLSLLLSLILVLLLWLVFGAAAGKREKPMGSGALTAFKVIFIISLVFLCLGLAATLILCVLTLVFGARSGLDAELSRYLNQLLRQYQLELPAMNLSWSVLAGILLGVLALFEILALVFLAKVIQSLNTAKRVIRSGWPDDRVSPFAALVCILGALVLGIGGVSLMAAGGLTGVLSGILALLNAVCLICYAVVIFRFRSGMRQLGVRKGVVQQNV